MKIEKNTHQILIIAFFLLLLTTYSWACAKNIIIMIGDGMGSEQIKAAGMFVNGEPGTLLFEEFPHKSSVSTHSANNSITDSAAAATAMACGIKVNNGVVSKAIPGDDRNLETVLEHYKAYAKSTGLVTTTHMTHATPACFGAHTSSRNNFSEIADNYFTYSKPNVLFGGGGFGVNRSIAENAGYKVVINRNELFSLDTENERFVSGQFGNGNFPFEYDGLENLPHLSEMTKTALHILDNNPNGFFLMVEGGLIDHAGHSNDIERNIRETAEFEVAVKEVLNWAENRNDTLLFVTADHETGGLIVINNNGIGNAPTVEWSSTGHTGVNVNIFAWGLHSELVLKIYDNTDIYKMLSSIPKNLPVYSAFRY